MAETTAAGRGGGFALFVCAVVLGLVGLHLGQAVFTPLAFALFVIALAAPLYDGLRPRIGHVLSLVLTVLVAMAVLVLFVLLFSWSVGRISSWALDNVVRLQDAYAALLAILDRRGLELEQILPDRFDPRWVIDPLLALLAQLRVIGNFLLLVFVFLVLGLNELEQTRARLRRIEAENAGVRLSGLLGGLGREYGTYMKVRVVATLIDMALVYLFFRLVGLDEPAAWAVLTGVLNFIPFIGPLLTALGLVIFSAAQFADPWMVLLVAGGATAINFAIGSYVEPIIAGNALKMSAVLVLLSVFLWAIVWGIPGAFLGVQITILCLAVLASRPGTAWIADLLSRGGAAADAGDVRTD